MPNQQLITISTTFHIALISPLPETEAVCDATGFAGRMLPYHQLLPSMVFCSGTSEALVKQITGKYIKF